MSELEEAERRLLDAEVGIGWTELDPVYTEG